MYTKWPVFLMPQFPMENATPSPSCSGRRKGNNANLETSAPLANTKQQLWSPRFKATLLEFWAPKSLMPLSPKQKSEVLRDELSAHIGNPQHREEGGQEHQTSTPQVLMLLQSLIPTISHCGAWQTLSSHTAEGPAPRLEPTLPLRRWGTLGGWQRLQYLRSQRAPTHLSRRIWAEAGTETRATLLECARNFLSFNKWGISNNAKFIWKIAHHF